MTAARQREIRLAWDVETATVMGEALAADPTDVVKPHGDAPSDYNLHGADVLVGSNAGPAALAGAEAAIAAADAATTDEPAGDKPPA